LPDARRGAALVEGALRGRVESLVAACAGRLGARARPALLRLRRARGLQGEAPAGTLGSGLRDRRRIELLAGSPLRGALGLHRRLAARLARPWARARRPRRGARAQTSERTPSSSQPW